MPDGVGAISAAVIAASGTLLVAYASNFLAEQYRRHLDSTSWAAALAGELESHAAAFSPAEGELARAGAYGEEEKVSAAVRHADADRPHL